MYYTYLQSDFKTIIEGTRASNNLPTGVNWNFYNSYPKFKKAVSSRQNHVLKLYVCNSYFVSNICKKNYFSILQNICSVKKSKNPW